MVDQIIIDDVGSMVGGIALDIKDGNHRLDGLITAGLSSTIKCTIDELRVEFDDAGIYYATFPAKLLTQITVQAGANMVEAFWDQAILTFTTSRQMIYGNGYYYVPQKAKIDRVVLWFGSLKVEFDRKVRINIEYTLVS